MKFDGRKAKQEFKTKNGLIVYCVKKRNRFYYGIQSLSLHNNCVVAQWAKVNIEELIEKY